MTATNVRPMTLADVVAEGSGSPDRLDEHLVSTASASAAVRALPPSTRRSVDAHLRSAVDAAMQRDVVSVLAGGWRVSDALRSAARATVDRPDVTELVELVTQTVTQDVRPSIDLMLDGRRLFTVELVLAVRATFRDVCLTVTAGALTGIDFGRCDVTVSLGPVTGTALLERTLTLSSNLRLNLSRPVPLLTHAETVEAAAPTR